MPGWLSPVSDQIAVIAVLRRDALAKGYRHPPVAPVHAGGRGVGAFHHVVTVRVLFRGPCRTEQTMALAVVVQSHAVKLSVSRYQAVSSMPIGTAPQSRPATSSPLW